MTKLIARLVLAALLFPLAIVLFIFGIAIAFQVSAPGPVIWILIWGMEYLFISIYWMAIWRSIVNWTPARIRNTILVTAGSLLAGALAVILLMAITDESEMAIGMAGMVPPVIWVLATVLVWRESDSERASRLTQLEGKPIECPSCGHDMRGLMTTTCPECGITFSLQQILLASPGIDSHEVEQHEEAPGT